MTVAGQCRTFTELSPLRLMAVPHQNRLSAGLAYCIFAVDRWHKLIIFIIVQGMFVSRIASPSMNYTT